MLLPLSLDCMELFLGGVGGPSVRLGVGGLSREPSLSMVGGGQVL